MNKRTNSTAISDVVVLGGTGFVGSAILRQLAGAKTVQVHVLARDPSRVRGSHLLRVVQGDLHHLPGDLFPPRPHIVVHLATKQIDSDRSGFHENNVEGTRNVLQRLTDMTMGITYGSSVSVYGQAEQINLDETAPLRPETPLAFSRAEAEHIILDTARQRGISAYCLRPRFIFGPGDQHTVPGLIRMVKRGIQPGCGSQMYTIIGVNDYASILLQLAYGLSAVPEQLPLNVGYLRPVSLQEIVREICDAYRLAPPWLRVPVRSPVTRVMRRLPGRALHTLATRMELFGLSHTFNLERLAARIGSELLSRNPMSALELTPASLVGDQSHVLR